MPNFFSHKLILLTLFFLLPIDVTVSNSYAQGKRKQSLTYAGKLIQKEKFDESIEYLRVMLRKNKKNYDAWTLLGVSYFHTGLPKRALKILKYAENKANNKPYNHYYQGLCYDALGKKRLSIKYFKMVAASRSPYADPAAFELSASFYNMKKKYEAEKWLNFYLGKFPEGRYRKKAIKMKRNLSRGKMSPKVSGIKKPNLEKALFKYSSLSLMEYPNFWYIETNGKYLYETGFEPSKDFGNKTSQDEVYALNFRSGIGVGPFRSDNITTFAGYSYNQTWNSTQDRMRTYFEDPIALNYFPFRPDLLEREHSFFGDVRAKLPYSLYAGAFLKYSINMYGSNLSGPEKWGITASYRNMDKTTFIPWAGYQWGKNHRSLLYWYFTKEINNDDNNFSYQTYSFGFDTFPISIGLTHSSDFPSAKTSLNLELYKYEFIYNDPYKDHNRIGGLVNITHNLIPTVDIELTGAYFTDTYIEPILKNNTCSSSTNGRKPTIDDPVLNCSRIDTGYLLEGQISWAYRQFYRVFFNFSTLTNTNSTLTEQGFEQQEILGGITLAFPSVKRTIRYSERFADKTLERSVRP